MYAPERDANVDSPYDPDGYHGIGGIRFGGGGVDAGHDTGTITTGCAARALVLFDRSSSMATPWTSGSTSGPRWQIAETALASAVTPHEAQLTVGAILFPSSEETFPSAMCAPVDPIASQIPFQSGASFLSVWAARWSSPDLLGSTPIDSAFDAADAALSGAGAETVVVLLTDGEPTCTGTIDAATRASSWRARGIHTWVVGLPGSSAGQARLDSIAAAGGTTTISADDPGALSTALSGIASTHVQSQCAP